MLKRPSANQGEAKSLLRRLCFTAPARFHQADWAMICLLADLSDPAFSGEMESLVEAYRGAGAFHPDISLAIANYYGKTGEQVKRDKFLRQIADRIGYGEEGATRMLASNLAPNSFEAESDKKVEGTYGWLQDMRSQWTLHLSNGSCRASNSNFLWGRRLRPGSQGRQ